ncbi:glutamyl-tRNA reductase [Natronoarchaeum philippinense]|uniref:Glutamyl-tRNA reductase n=1 Tax=Natronoarchaeum philippinense TaxID=558529 RepID=A0A285NG03_NATPI|nr:glutamyl-tRNA reductase [Natronoarchaeum philippinense]SNZ06591.1 glutamyl-tRNA reductase [Natronoarchaeum philippinense]
MLTGSGVISGVSVAHDRASVDEIADAGADDQRAEVERLLTRPGVEEAFALHTCNRTEAYVVTDDQTVGRATLAGFADEASEDAVVYTDHEESLRHLMRVAAGLESLVLGEDQIIGQVRTAYEDARGVGGIGPMLDEAVTKAIHVGERVRTETAFNQGVLSLGSAAAEVATEELSLETATALVVGAGEMGTLAAKSLADRDVAELVIANRTVPHAEHVAKEVTVDASAVALPAAETVAETADLVVTTTASDEPLLDAETFADGGETTVVDIAQPRDVDPEVAELTTVSVFDLDDLQSVTAETERRRRESVAEVEAIIDREFDRLLEQYKRKRADEVIAAMYESAERVKSEEVSTAVSKLEADIDGELPEAQREVIEAMADSLVSQLLAAPTKSLREAAAEDDWTTINTALQLFDPDFGGDDGPPAFVSELLDEEPEELPTGVSADIPDEIAEKIPEDITAKGLSDD